MKTITLKVKVTEAFSNKLLELGNLDIPENYSLGGSRAHQIVASMANSLLDSMSKRGLVKTNDFGGIEEPPFKDMTIEGDLIYLEDVEVEQ